MQRAHTQGSYYPRSGCCRAAALSLYPLEIVRRTGISTFNSLQEDTRVRVATVAIRLRGVPEA